MENSVEVRNRQNLENIHLDGLIPVIIEIKPSNVLSYKHVALE